MTSLTLGEKLDSIIEQIYMNGVDSAAHGIYVPLPNPTAKQALADFIEEEVGRVIGDNDNQWNGTFEDSVRILRNELRHEQRRRLKRLMEGLRK